MFTPADLTQMAQRGANPETVARQLTQFKEGFPYLPISRPATAGDGIRILNEADLAQAVATYEQRLPGLKVIKFVPASGAASRMFKSLFSFLETYNDDAPDAGALQEDPSVNQFFSQLGDFAFYLDLAEALDGEDELNSLLGESRFGAILKAFLTDNGLGYGNLPKGLLKFHKYPGSNRTAAEEHLVEAALYGAVKGGEAYVHFTVSPEHRSRFEALIGAVKAQYEKAHGVKLNVSFSEQKPATDTIAADGENQPFRKDDGTLLFRPGGHGALIENLNDLSADVVFIKNIDNVVPDGIKDETVRYKKALAGVLLSVQAQVFDLLSRMDGEVNEALVQEAAAFVTRTLHIELPAGFEGLGTEAQAAYLKGKLNRPIRVCGMVKNEGEPGGGPFWAGNPDGSVSLQVVESAQFNLKDPAQRAIFQASSHFNPVDLICSWKDRHGHAFDLPKYVDPQTGFISSKSQSGRELKALELPGLWNGAMSDWNTLFVEVPIITFNPVKTVNDLLRPQHQA